MYKKLWKIIWWFNVLLWPVFFFVPIAHAAIAVDATANYSASSGSSITIPFTNAGTLLACGYYADNTVSGTFNGDTMSLADIDRTDADTGHSGLLYLFNPSLGTHDVILTSTSGVVYWGACSSYTGTATSIEDSAGTTGHNTTPLTVSVTTGTASSWLVGYGYNNNGAAVSAGSATFKRTSASTQAMFDSNGNVSAGSNSLELDIASGGSGSEAFHVLTVPPGSGGGGTTTDATSTISFIDNPNQNLFNGILLFFFGMYSTIWLFSKKR